MEFTVPQFIEKEPKIVGPFNFKQFVYIFVAGGLCIFLYFTVPFTVFIFAAIFFMGMAFGLAFVKIERTPLPVFVKNMVLYLMGGKIYLWKKKAISASVLLRENAEEEVEEAPELKVAKKSRLKTLFTRLQTKSK